MTVSIGDLPDEVLAGILALVPFSKNKVGVQCVCKNWLRILQTQEAHSTDTLWEDESLQCQEDPTLAVEKNGVLTKLLSEAFMDALACLKFESKVPREQDGSGGLPSWQAQHLQLLHVVQMRQILLETNLRRLFQELEHLPNLKLVQVIASGGIVDFSGPYDCHVDNALDFFHSREDPSSRLWVPWGMAGHLRNLSLWDRQNVRADPHAEVSIKQVSLARLCLCRVLEQIHVDLKATDQIETHFLHMKALPKTVSHIYVHTREGDAPHLWQMADGWETAPEGFIRTGCMYDSDCSD